MIIDFNNQEKCYDINLELSSDESDSDDEVLVSKASAKAEDDKTGKIVNLENANVSSKAHDNTEGENVNLENAYESANTQENTTELVVENVDVNQDLNEKNPQVSLKRVSVEKNEKDLKRNKGTVRFVKIYYN